MGAYYAPTIGKNDDWTKVRKGLRLDEKVSRRAYQRVVESCMERGISVESLSRKELKVMAKSAVDSMKEAKAKVK